MKGLLGEGRDLRRGRWPHASFAAADEGPDGEGGDLRWRLAEPPPVSGGVGWKDAGREENGDVLWVADGVSGSFGVRCVVGGFLAGAARCVVPEGAADLRRRTDLCM